MERNCSKCKENRVAYSLCTNCNEWLCSPCTEEHQHNKNTGEHMLSLTEKGPSGPNSIPQEFCLFCPYHNQEPLKLFCETCNLMTCQSCQMSEHKDHRFRYLQEALQNQNALFKSLTSQVEEKKLSLQTSAKQLEDRLYEIKHIRRKVENQIKMAKMVLMNELNKRTNVLLEQLERLTSERKQKLEEQLQAAAVLCKQLEHVQNFIRWSAYKKNSIPFHYNKNLIVCQMRRLLETQCNTDLGSPCRLKFNWEPAHWAKQLSNLGNLTFDTGNQAFTNAQSFPSAPSYGNMHGPQPPFYQGHSSSQRHRVANQNQRLPTSYQCQTPTCCSQCHNMPRPHKGQLSHSGVQNQHTFQQPQIPQQHFPVQYRLSHSGKQQRYVSHSQKNMQHIQPQTEHEQVQGWMGKPLHILQGQQSSHSTCITQPQGNLIQQMHSGHSQRMQSLPEPTTAMPMQLSHLQQLQLQHVTQQQQMPTDAAENVAHEQAMQQNLDIMNQQYELEQMQKGLELLLQAQQPNLQLNQTKPPQQVQQTIVGQINYIVRQPAPQSQQVSAEPLQIGFQPTPENNQGQNHRLQQQTEHSEITHLNVVSQLTVNDVPVLPNIQQPLVQNNGIITPSITHLFGEQNRYPPSAQTSANCSRESSLTQNRKRSISGSLLSPSCTSGMDASSLRPPNSANPQLQDTTNSAEQQLCSILDPSELSSGNVPCYSSTIGSISEEMTTKDTENPSTSIAHFGKAQCKTEEEYMSAGEAFGRACAYEELAHPDSGPDEPINLSIKKCDPLAFSPLPDSSAHFMDSSLLSHVKTEEDTEDSEAENAETSESISKTNRTYIKGKKVPYVRLERLNISPSALSDLPVFKLQSKIKQEDCDSLLEYDNQSFTPPTKDVPDYTTAKSEASIADAYEGKTEANEQAVCINTSETSPPTDIKLNGENTETPNEQIEPEQNSMENEDFCAVCLNGGELLCCDHCPKVFHLTCHVPALHSFPVGEWDCSLCCKINSENENEYETQSHNEDSKGKKLVQRLSYIDQKKCEKLVLYICCNSFSLPFHEPVSPLARHYYQIIKKPMDLSVIREKLKKDHPSHYSSPKEFVLDVRLMFQNCAKFNYPDSEVAQAGRKLAKYFEEKLKELYPDKAFLKQHRDSTEQEETENADKCVNSFGFLWPLHDQEHVKPKKRRRHSAHQKTKDPSYNPGAS
ncbi:tripartite motif-containing protein 66 [Protopterus annectens]|uniref:tripartite motif-containing protein 66 n=1 Tax=Protopterus annectens TaxID=7888 RepID=UPI001CFC102A|nr:tripartite motif-containing protein 66 [Protopterus annectens]